MSMQELYGGRGCAGAVLGGLLALAACTTGNTYKPPPPPTVTVAKPVSGLLEDVLQTDGIVSGTQFVEIRAQVEGRITAIHFEDGQNVEQGQPLFTIDPRTYKAAASTASAEASALRAQLQYARSHLDRTRSLYERGSVSLEDYDQARQKVRTLQAQLSAASASAQGAKVTLDYTRVESPIAGRISRRMVDKGQLVGAGEPTLLATVVSRQGTYVEFSISQTEIAWFRLYLSKHPEAKARIDREGLEVRAGLPGEQGFPHIGKLQSAENVVNASTGTLSARGIFDNPEGTLVPGLFCRVEIPVGRSEGLAVPETATALDQVGRYVFVVTKKGKVERRNVVLGAKRRGFVRIEEGLKASDRVVVKGMVRVRVGSRAKTVTDTLEFPSLTQRKAPNTAAPNAAATNAAATNAAATNAAATNTAATNAAATNTAATNAAAPKNSAKTRQPSASKANASASTPERATE